MNWNEKFYGQGKLTYRPFSGVKVKLQLYYMIMLNTEILINHSHTILMVILKNLELEIQIS